MQASSAIRGWSSPRTWIVPVTWTGQSFFRERVSANQVSEISIRRGAKSTMFFSCRTSTLFSVRIALWDGQAWATWKTTTSHRMYATTADNLATPWRIWPKMRSSGWIKALERHASLLYARGSGTLSAHKTLHGSLDEVNRAIPKRS